LLNQQALQALHLCAGFIPLNREGEVLALEIGYL
jgi:hypothetical protein